MEETDSKICPNCKREIPTVNFTIHTVHCARNIKVCPVCKEPVPQHELQDHHDKLHKLMPCKQCGESVCGTDLEDHIRDSCGHTIKSCRYCELELPRHELPAHEGYCGVRTEQCSECREWVMIKYRQLHLDSNHGFLRLDDDPVPQPKKVPPKVNTNAIRDMLASSSNGIQPSSGPRAIETNRQFRNSSASNRIRNEISGSGGGNASNSFRNDIGGGSSVTSGGSGGAGGSGRNGSVDDGRIFGIPVNTSSEVTFVPLANGAAGSSGEARRPLVKRSNDQPQINTTVTSVNKVHKDMAISRGAVKKRPAPKPPADRKRDLQYYSALQRQQAEDKQRQQQSAYNASVGLPPVISAAAKLDKLRKMDALHNREVENNDYKNKLQGRVWMNAGDPSTSDGHRLGSNSPEDLNVRNELRDLKPMTPAEFMARFEQLQLRGDRPGSDGDRFSEIKSSLRELRRGLKEVTAPYNSNSANNQNDRPRRRSPSSPRSPRSSPTDELAVGLPCEFCGALVPAHDLVQHQTGCRPDLTQYRPRSRSPPPPSPSRRSPPPPPPADPYEQPVIPCEFCTESLPVYLISEHQERCRRDPNLLFPD